MNRDYFSQNNDQRQRRGRETQFEPEGTSQQPQMMPGQMPTAPQQPQMMPRQPQMAPRQPMTMPGQQMEVPEQLMTMPGQMPTPPGRPMTMPGQMPTPPGRPMTMPGQRPTPPGSPMTMPGQRPTAPRQPRTMPEQPQAPGMEARPRSAPPSFTPEIPGTFRRPMGRPYGFDVQYQYNWQTRANELRTCLYRFTYIWLINGNAFWFFPTFIDRRFVQGFRWRNNGWQYDRISLNRILFSRCF